MLKNIKKEYLALLLGAVFCLEANSQAFSPNMAPMTPSMNPNAQMYYGMPQQQLPMAQMQGQMPQGMPMIDPQLMMQQQAMMQQQMQQPQQPPSVMEQALSLHQAGRYADAIHLYESIIFTGAPDPRLYASIADAHFRLGNLERAMKYTVEALKLDPDYASGHLLLGTILGEMGDLVRAMRSYQKVLVLDQNNPYAYYNLGLLYYKKAEVKSAIEYLEKAKDLNPNDPKIWNNLGVAYYDQGMMPQALIAYAEALRLNPKYETAAKNLVLVRNNMPAPQLIQPAEQTQVKAKPIAKKTTKKKVYKKK